MAGTDNSFDDYSLTRVPESAKQPMWRATLIRLGALACVSQLMIGAELGYKMTFMQSMLAVFLGSVLLQVVGYGIGVAAAREGLSTSMLARWTGFGSLGSALIGLVIAICLTGWFGVQNAVFAKGMLKATGILNFEIWAVITGVAVVAIVTFGFKMLSITANIAFPLFMLAVAIAFIQMVTNHNIGDLMTGAAPAPVDERLSMAQATTIVAGGFIIGAVTTPDLSRFLRKPKEVFWMVAISTFVGELGMCAIAVLLAHAAKSSDILSIMLGIAGWLSAAIVMFSTIKTNDFNLYSASLGITTSLNAFFKRLFDRGTVTIIVGVAGTILSAFGIMENFASFLIVLGVAVPPIASIMMIDYFLLKRDRKTLDDAREKGELPKTVEALNPIAIVSWIIGFLVGYFLKSGIPTLNAILASAVAYWALSLAYQAIRKDNSGFQRVEA